MSDNDILKIEELLGRIEYLEKENKQLKKELEKADSITQSCIFNGKKDSEISYRRCLNMLDESQQENKQLKDNWNKLKEYIKENIIYDDIGMKIFDVSLLEDKMAELENGDSNE